MTEIRCNLLVIGAGPGGYSCAVRAGQLGLDTVIVDPNPPGGTCLNVGCIPSKALIHAADQFHRARHGNDGNPFGISYGSATINLAQTVAWKDGIVKRLNGGVSGVLARAGVRSISSRAYFVDGKTVTIDGPDGPSRVRGENVVIATGARPAELPGIAFGGAVISSTQALALTAVPNRLMVVGAGYIGLELGIAFAKLGTAVTIIEAASRLLPQYDSELSKPVAERLSQLGVTLLADTLARSGGPDGLRISRGDEEELLPCDHILLAVGRVPVTDGFGLESLGIETNGPWIAIDERCRTSMRGVYAIGDVTGEPMLAHRAMAQGELVAERIAGGRRRWEPAAIPAVCFTDPEIVSVGLSPDQARAAGFDIRVGRSPLQANGRALTLGQGAGFVRIVARADNHLLLGIQAVGAELSELAASFALALEMGARLEDLADTIHAHPTQGESVHAAARAALQSLRPSVTGPTEHGESAC